MEWPGRHATLSRPSNPSNTPFLTTRQPTGLSCSTLISTQLLTCRLWRGFTVKAKQSLVSSIECLLPVLWRRVRMTSTWRQLLITFHLMFYFKLVVYQRQLQKGSLTTITVDGPPSAATSSAKFTKEELRDCFTLKEDCDCDTKRKVGKLWPDYGTSSIWLHRVSLRQSIVQYSAHQIPRYLMQTARQASRPRAVMTLRCLL